MTFSRPSTVWTIFAICCVGVVLGTAWVTNQALRLERSRQQAEVNGDLQERIRLALWRMDSVAGALVFSESARPPDQFKDFHASDQLYTNTYQIVQKGQIIVPSPLLSTIPKHSKLYFQIDPEGNFTSPQVPSGNSRDLAEQNYMASEDIESARLLLEQVGEFIVTPSAGESWTLTETQIPAEPPVLGWTNEESKNTGEFQSRFRAASQSGLWFNNPGAKINAGNDLALQQAASAGVNLTRPDSAEPFRGVWRKGELFLTRQATLDGSAVVQFIWLEADAIKEILLAKLRDLLPQATLSPSSAPTLTEDATAPSMITRTQSLVTLPFNLEPGEVTRSPSAFWSPVRRSLAIAWACVFGSAGAAGLLIFGIVGLSERRAAFVSAVTHEMRTPLTTFRLYSEMLSQGMVKDPEKRKGYLTTLTSEADRLSHLVENVLAYARLEKGSARARLEDVTLQTVIDRVKPRLEQRTAQDGVEICVEATPSAARTRVRVDLTAVEQILFNLVDNACKYGRQEDHANVIRLEADTDGPMALLRIRDHGHGISKTDERRLFRPFEKSADEAAHTAHGVGLGLALCRKLSRALGGDLKLCGNSEGACFVLTLPSLTNR